jgi:hypothetical protein
MRRSVVKIGDTMALYWAALTNDGSDPFVLGERHSIQIPHQHMILEIRAVINNTGGGGQKNANPAYSPK